MFETILLAAALFAAYHLGAKGTASEYAAKLAASEDDRLAAEEEAKQCRCAAELFKAAYDGLKTTKGA